MTQLAGASIAARTKGRVAQYGVSGTNASATITPRDSGTIVVQTKPGKSPEKLVDGTIQNAADLTVDGTAGKVGNALLWNANGQNYATDPFTAAAGVSLSPSHE